MSDTEFSETQPNYINYLKEFFKLKISHYLPSASNMLFIVLLHEANELGFPSRFNLPNSTLAKTANIKIHNLHRDRQKLLEFRLLKDDDNSWLVRYDQGFYPEAGEYMINYELLSQVNHNLSIVKSQNNHKLITDESQSQKNMPKNEDIHIQYNTIPDNINNPSDKRFHDIFTKIKRICPTYPPNKNLEKANANIESISTFSDEEIDSAIAKTYEKVKTKAVNAFGIDGYILSILNNKSVYASNQSRQITDSVPSPPALDPIEEAFKDFHILMNQVFDYKNFLEFGDFPANVNIYTDGWVDTGKDLLAKPGFRPFLAENHPDMLEAFTKILELVERGA